MIQAVSNTIVSQVSNQNQNVNEEIKQAAPKKISDNVVDVQSVAPKKVEGTSQQDESAGVSISPAYTVEISEAGTSALKKSAPPPDASLSKASSSSDSTSSVDTTNLTQYTASQLSELVSQGVITQAEVNQELAKREQESDSGNQKLEIAGIDEGVK